MVFFHSLPPTSPEVIPWLFASTSSLGGVLLGVRSWNQRGSLYTILKRLTSRKDTSPKLIQSLSEQMATLLCRRDLYPAILAYLGKTAEVSNASLLIRDASHTFQVKAILGAKPLSFDAEPLASFFHRLQQHPAIVQRTEITTLDFWKEAKNEALSYLLQFHAEVCLPLFSREQLIGIVNFGRRERGGYPGDLLEKLTLLGNFFALALHNEMLEQYAVRQRCLIEQSKKLKEQILANVSHEMRTPLTSIIGLSEMLAEGVDGEVNAEQMEHLHHIRKAGCRLLEVISSMIDVSRVTSEHTKLNIQKVDVRHLLESMVQEMVSDSTIQFLCECETGPSQVYGDPLLIRQVVKELLENAAKFTKKGTVRVKAVKVGDMLKICVADTGNGIPREKQQEIFDQFVQGDGSLTREHQGLGLGLSLSRRIVELHGGRLWVVSRLGRGSSFYFTLPLRAVALKCPEISNVTTLFQNTVVQ